MSDLISCAVLAAAWLTTVVGVLAVRARGRR